MAWLPGRRLLVVTEARPQFGPPPGTSAGVPRTPEPSAIVTTPVGAAAGVVLAPLGHTVSVSVTGWPNCDGLPDEVITVVTGARPTTWVSEAELAAKLPLPLYAASTVCEPGASVGIGADVARPVVVLTATGPPSGTPS